MTFKENFVDPRQIRESIELIQKMSSEQGFRAILVGGVALQVYGSPKFTKDVDFAVDELPGNEKPLRRLNKISFGGERYSSPSGAKIDLIARADEYRSLYEDAILHAIEDPSGTPIVTPEYLAIMKLAAGREHDILALKWMIRQQGLLDIKKAKSIAYRYLGRFGQDRFDDIVDQAQIELEMMRRRGRHPEEE